MGNCVCNYTITNSDVVISSNSEIQSTLSNTDNIPVPFQELTNANSLKSMSGFRKRGPILVKLQSRYKKVL